MRQLINASLLVVAAGAAVAAMTEIVGSTIDTQGYEDVSIVASLGAITAGGVPTLKAAQGDLLDGTDKADIVGSHVAANDTQSNQFLVLEIHRPKNRYITPILDRLTANCVVKEIFVILSGASHVPVTQTQVAGYLALNTPDAGTA